MNFFILTIVIWTSFLYRLSFQLFDICRVHEELFVLVSVICFTLLLFATLYLKRHIQQLDSTKIYAKGKIDYYEYFINTLYYIIAGIICVISFAGVLTVIGNVFPVMVQSTSMPIFITPFIVLYLGYVFLKILFQKITKQNESKKSQNYKMARD